MLPTYYRLATDLEQAHSQEVELQSQALQQDRAHAAQFYLAHQSRPSFPPPSKNLLYPLPGPDPESTPATAKLRAQFIFEQAPPQEAVNTSFMEAAVLERKLVRTIRIFPLVTILLLLIAYALGGFSERANPLVPRSAIRAILIFYIAVVPTALSALFIWADLKRKRDKKHQSTSLKKLAFDNAFELPAQEMHGHKIVYITGRNPTFTGLTGDLYSSDEAATCKLDSEHIPPVADCECGFYAYKEIGDAKYEKSIHPTSFLIDVDLFGIGFAYSRGFRAESQRVNSMSLPKRCMRCKTLPALRFVTTYKIGYYSYSYWKWEIRCAICSYSFKPEDCLTPDEMAQALGVKLISG